MATYKLYKMPYGYILINPEDDATPQGYTAGPWDVNDANAQMITDNTARVDFNQDGTISVVSQEEQI